MRNKQSRTLLAEVTRLNDWYNEKPNPGVWYWYVFERPDGTYGSDGMHDDVAGCVEAKTIMSRLDALTTPVAHYLLKQRYGGYEIGSLPEISVPVNEEAIANLNEMDRQNRMKRRL